MRHLGVRQGLCQGLASYITALLAPLLGFPTSTQEMAVLFGGFVAICDRLVVIFDDIAIKCSGAWSLNRLVEHMQSGNGNGNK